MVILPTGSLCLCPFLPWQFLFDWFFSSSMFYSCVLLFKPWGSLCNIPWMEQALWLRTMSMLHLFCRWCAASIYLEVSTLPPLHGRAWFLPCALLKWHLCPCHSVGTFLSLQLLSKHWHWEPEVPWKQRYLLFSAQSTDVPHHRVQQTVSHTSVMSQSNCVQQKWTLGH